MKAIKFILIIIAYWAGVSIANNWPVKAFEDLMEVDKSQPVMISLNTSSVNKSFDINRWIPHDMLYAPLCTNLREVVVSENIIRSHKLVKFLNRESEDVEESNYRRLIQKTEIYRTPIKLIRIKQIEVPNCILNCNT